MFNEGMYIVPQAPAVITINPVAFQPEEQISSSSRLIFFDFILDVKEALQRHFCVL